MPALPFIQSIDALAGLHVFRSYTADPALPTLRRRNLLYGFNGCGKTTLSRLLASFGTGTLDASLPSECTFSLSLTDSSTLTTASPSSSLCERVFVINEQFVEDNFTWSESRANAVFYIGQQQQDALARLESKERDRVQLRSEQLAAEARCESAESALVQHKRDAARTIAEQLSLGRRYNAATLDADYSDYTPAGDDHLPDSELVALRALLLQDEPDPQLNPVSIPSVDLNGLRAQCVDLCSTSVESVVLQEFQVHDSMLPWARTGLEYHESNALATCLLCGGPLTTERLAYLAHTIDDRFAALSDLLQSTIGTIQASREQLANWVHTAPNPAECAKALRQEYEDALASARAAIDAQSEHLASMDAVLANKAKRPTHAVDTAQVPMPELLSESDATVAATIRKINGLVERHNQIHREFNETKIRASERLKRHYLAEGKGTYDQLRQAVTQRGRERSQLVIAIASTDREIDDLRRQTREHGPAATLINGMIKAYLGHGELQIAAIDEGYRLLRNGQPASSPPSEGERTAIVLCYFLVMLRADNRKLEDLIVVLDDPISSLDTRAMNYAAAMIQSSLADAGQLIVLTHNLQLMNEMKKWMKPLTESGLRHRGKDPADATAAMFFIETVQPNGQDSRMSSIIELPKYIREYESEYQYLFHLVLRCRDRAEGREAYYFVMPNALRKILDVFLAFKEPGGMGLTPKLQKVGAGAGLEGPKLVALERLAQAESHADNLDDLVSFSSMTVEELDNAISSLLEFIEVVDKTHFDRMCSLCRP